MTQPRRFHVLVRNGIVRVPSSAEIIIVVHIGVVVAVVVAVPVGKWATRSSGELPTYPQTLRRWRWWTTLANGHFRR